MSRSRPIALGTAGASAVVLLVWLLATDAPRPADPIPSPVQSPVQSRDRRSSPLLPGASSLVRHAPVAPTRDRRRQARPVKPQAATSGLEALQPSPSRPPSHPLSAEHRRIRRENGLIRRLNDALDMADAETMRALLDEYEQVAPDDPNAMRSGYAVLADCLEQTDDEVVARAQAYYDTERASTLRRFVRRTCLESNG